MLDRRRLLAGAGALGAGLVAGRLARAAEPAEIPLLEQRGRFLIDVALDADAGFQFVLDTGASAHFISMDIVERLRLPQVEVRNVRGYDGRDARTVVRLGRMDVGGHALSGAQAIAWSAEALEGHDGLVGYPILGQRARIDLRARTLRLGAPSPEGAIRASAEVLRNQTLLVGGWEAAPGRFVFDTGSTNCVVSRDYLERLKETAVYRDAPKLMTADAEHRLRMVGFRPAELRFGDLVVKEPAVRIADSSVSPEMFRGVDALFGANLIRRFVWTVDQEHGALHAAPYA